jgi:DNA-binding winged helix-turn-helix (wHTH) protein/tetratricopeptide (TPR) repeat protein
MGDGGVSLPRHPPPALLGRDSERAWCAQSFSRHRVLAICGLAGIGKTSLLLTAAHEQARRVEGTVAYHVCTEGDRIGGVLASLLAGDQSAAPRAISLRAALDEVVAWARKTPLVLCIDDAHRIADPLLLDVLAHLGAVSAPLWLVVASRRQLPLPETDIDGAMLRLGPLSMESARALWDDLEDRFGPPIVRFDALDVARRGSPFALRRAFATGLAGDEDGVDLTGLAPEQAALLAQICAFDGAVDLDRLATVIPDRIAALRGLLQALLVDVTAARTITVHDLVRAAVARSFRPPAVAEHLVCLKFYEAGGNDLARLRHTVGSEQWAAAAELIDKIMRPHYGFFPMGAVVERQVLAAFGALDRARIELSLSLRLTRLQLAARCGQGGAVLEALRSEAALEPAAWAHLGAVELLLGDARAAEGHFRQALAAPSTVGGPIVQVCLLGLLLEALRTQGDVEAMRNLQGDFERVAAQLGPIGTAVAQVIIAAMSYDQENYQDAAARLASARPFIALLTLAPSLQAMHALLDRACSAALVTSPDDVLPSSAVAHALFEDVDLLRATLLLFAADGDVIEGNVRQAEARARDAEEITRRVGYRGIHQWALYVRVECLRMRGLAAEAAELAEQALAEPLVDVHRRHQLLLRAASALSLAQLGRMQEARRKVGSLDGYDHAPVKAARLSILPWIEPANAGSDLARAELALAQLARTLADGKLEQAVGWSERAGLVRGSRWQYLRARLAVLEGELAVRTGDAAGTERALGEAEALCAEHGYRREHATAALVAVALARLAADTDRARYWAGVAAARAAGVCADIEAATARLMNGSAGSAGAPDPWIDRLDLAGPRLFRLREPTAVRYLTRRQADAVRFVDGSFDVDALRQTVHVGGATHSLARRPGLWSVLSALLTEPGRVMSPDELARHAWGVGYHAVRHRSRLVVSIKRLRDELGGEFITSVGGGYRLAVHMWTVLEPRAEDDEDRPTN